MEDFDICVIGGGPGGYVAAIRAAQLGKKVALIEKEQLGGVCLNWGCIPTKALLKSAEIYQNILHANDFGFEVSATKIDIKKIVDRSRRISAQLTSGIKTLLNKNKVHVIYGTASFQSNKILNITSKDKELKIKGQNIIIATGARPRILQSFEPNGSNVWTSKEAMIPDALPKTLIVVGSGAIGVEFASFYNALGVEVTILEAQNRILPSEDEEISTLARKLFEKRGIKIITEVKLLKYSNNSTHLTLETEVQGKLHQIQAEKLLMAIGITANTENLNLEKIGVRLEQGHIATNGFLQTSEPNIYAIGDVAGAPWLAHKASHQGIIAAEHIAGLAVSQLHRENIPGCTYSFPQIASVGLTEKQALDKGLKVKIGRFPLVANGKALVLGEKEGLIKTIIEEKSGELIGAHMIGAEVTELIQGYVIAKNLEATEIDLIHTIFPHPTISEAMHESILQAYLRAIHI